MTTSSTARQLVDRQKVLDSLSLAQPMTPEDLDVLAAALEDLELEAVSLWNPDDEEDALFRLKCSEILRILETTPRPPSGVPQAIFLMRLVTYAYLSERWEAARRYMGEQYDSIVLGLDEPDWGSRLLQTTSLALWHVVRKRGWADLEEATALVATLRSEQAKYEAEYLAEERTQGLHSLELASLYHLAKATELVATYQLSGAPADVLTEVEFHLDAAVAFRGELGDLGFTLLLQMLKATYRKMIMNTLWYVAAGADSLVADFIQSMRSQDDGVVELLYPQKSAVAEQGLLNPAHRAVVVSLPTSSGKTLIAEFRMLQAINQFRSKRGWVAYIAPTRALVNQVHARLKRDFRHLGLLVEKTSPALELDAFEASLLEPETQFDVLVATPEKLALLIRQGMEAQLGRPLTLVVVDEAHNLGEGERGIALELLLATLRGCCADSRLLLLTPFIDNADDLARWLDPQSPKAIRIGVDWRPNDHVVGLVTPEGQRRQYSITYEPTITSQPTLHIDESIELVEFQGDAPKTYSQLTKADIASAAAPRMMNGDTCLVIAYTKDQTFDVANSLYEQSSSTPNLEPDLELARAFVADELGSDFPLVRLLERRIAVHHAGLPDEVRRIVELLASRGRLDYLVATTTIAQGINFPVGSLIMSSLAYPLTGAMPYRDFWNLVGRVGRVNHRRPGLVGVVSTGGTASEDSQRIKGYLAHAVGDLASFLRQMLDGLTREGDELDLGRLHRRPEWAAFLQYITHMFSQADSLSDFISQAELTLRRTFGYRQLSVDEQRLLKESVVQYARRLADDPGSVVLSNSTGFTFESIRSVMGGLRGSGISPSEWSPNSILSKETGHLRKLVGIMLRAPEAKRGLEDLKLPGDGVDGDTIASMIVDWVGGKSIPEITRSYYGSADEHYITRCTTAIYGTLVHSASWGLSAIQAAFLAQHGSELSDGDVARMRNLPAMIYYGVSSDAGVLMRLANVPRSIADGLGRTYQREADPRVFSPNAASRWIDAAPEHTWDEAAHGRSMTGSQYREVWKWLTADC